MTTTAPATLANALAEALTYFDMSDEYRAEIADRLAPTVAALLADATAEAERRAVRVAEDCLGFDAAADLGLALAAARPAEREGEA